MGSVRDRERRALTVALTGAGSGGDMARAMQRAAAGAEAFAAALGKMADTRQVLNGLVRDLGQMWAWMEKAAGRSAVFRAACGRLRQALEALARPVVRAVIPALVRLTDLLTALAVTAARALDRLLGLGLGAGSAAGALGEEADALDRVGTAAREAEGSLAAFDEINQIDTEPRGGSGSGSGGGGTDPGFAQLVGRGLDAVTELCTGLGMLALGAILAFSGASVPLGLGLMAAGALFLADAVTADWTVIQTALQGPVGEVMALVCAAALALGAILLFSGASIPLGLGLVLAGAVGLAAVAAARWDTMTQKLGGPLRTITTLAAGALLALGVILLLSGAGVGLGLGLILAGAAGLAAAAAPDWEWLTEKLTQVWSGVRSAAEQIRDGLTEIFGGIWNFIRTTLNWIIGGVEGFVNNFLAGINALLSGINALGSLLGFTLNWRAEPLRLPRLARGTVVPPNREFLAVLGDNRQETEVVSPLSTIRQAVAEALRENGGAAPAGDIHVTLELDGQTVARTCVRHINEMTAAAGRPVLMI